MWTVYYNQNGSVAGRLEGRHKVEDAPYPGNYRIEYLVTSDDVREEAQRRIMALLGARDEQHLDVLISNGSREAIRLLRKGAGNWTPKDRARARQQEQIDLAIETIRTASNTLEAMEKIPMDYTDDMRWQ